jgi:hypothetical protein
MTSRNTWKQRERDIAEDFGTKRNPLSGSMSGHSSSDSLSDTFYLESKLRANPPGWNLFLDTKEKAKKEKKIPVVVISKKFHKDKIAMVDYDFLVSLLEKSGYLPRKVDEQRCNNV